MYYDQKNFCTGAFVLYVRKYQGQQAGDAVHATMYV